MEDGIFCSNDLAGFLVKLNNAKTKEVQVSRPLERGFRRLDSGEGETLFNIYTVYCFTKNTLEYTPSWLMINKNSYSFNISKLLFSGEN